MWIYGAELTCSASGLFFGRARHLRSCSEVARTCSSRLINDLSDLGDHTTCLPPNDRLTADRVDSRRVTSTYLDKHD